MRRAVVVGVVLLVFCGSGVVTGTPGQGVDGSNTASGVSITLEPNTSVASYEPGSTYAFDLVATDLEEPIGSYDIEITASDTNVATLTAFDPVAGPEAFTAVQFSDSNGSVVVTAANVNRSLTPTDGSVRIGTLTVETVANGSVSLAPSVQTLTNVSADWMVVDAVSGVTLTVESDTEPTIPAFPGSAGPPTNTDDDPLLEDVDGDGDTDVFDALTYYNNRDSDIVQNNPTQFDYDGTAPPGTIFDALELYNEIAG